MITKASTLTLAYISKSAAELLCSCNTDNQESRSLQSSRSFPSSHLCGCLRVGPLYWELKPSLWVKCKCLNVPNLFAEDSSLLFARELQVITSQSCFYLTVVETLISLWTSKRKKRKKYHQNLVSRQEAAITHSDLISDGSWTHHEWCTLLLNLTLTFVYLIKIHVECITLFEWTRSCSL